MYFKFEAEESWRKVIALSQTLVRLECSTQEDVNLIKNPERNTGYNGSHIWQAMRGGKMFAQRLGWGSCLRFSPSTELMFLRFRSIQLPNTSKYNIIFVHKLIDWYFNIFYKFETLEV